MRTQHLDEKYMNIALTEAKKGIGFTSPNPIVGTVIVKNNKILSTGYHKKIGGEHAEVNAINKLTNEQLKGSTLYVTLEPCSHHGKTPPCTDAIIKSGIKEVIIASNDIDERVNGLKILHDAGIKIKTGILEEEALRINSLYFFYKKNKRPYIVLKAALTLDGKIAANSGDSKWISSENCRKIVHKLRLRLKAIAVGKNTLTIDKPRLNCRIKKYENKPVDKLIFSNENIDTSSLPDNPGKTYIINRKISRSRESFIDFCNKNEIDSILIEGGGKVYTWFLENNLVDRIYLFYKPSFLGKDGVEVFTKTGTNFINELKDFKIIKTEIIDNNILIELSNGESLCLLD